MRAGPFGSAATAIVLVLGSVATPVCAADALDATPQEEARKRFAQGVSLMDERRFAEALDEFQQAYALWDNPKILLNLATALLALDRPAEAAARYAAYLDSGAATPERAGEVKELLEKLQPRVARLVVAPSGGVQRVELDGASVATESGRPLWLAPGRHVLVIVYADGQRLTHSFEARGGELATVEGAALHPRPATTQRPREPNREPNRDRDRDRDRGPERSSSEQRQSAGSRWALTVRADIDGIGRGGVGAVGLIAPLEGPFRVSAGALVGARGGAWLGMDATAKLGAFRPSLGASVPTFFASQLYPGLAAELGVRYELDWVASPFVRVAVVHFLRVPDGYVSTVAVPSVGVEVPL